MPELPEVETVKLGLQKLLPGRRVEAVDFDTEKSFPNAPADVEQFLVGAKVLEVKRRAKVVIVVLDTKYSLLIHLKMTGQLVFVGKERFGAGHPNDSLINELPDRSTRVTLDFGDAKLYFNDQRKFGWVRLIPTTEISKIDFMKKLGPEPLAADFTAQAFVERLQRRKNSTIKAVLLDQTVVAGIGNIYADEGLWAAKIHPSTLVKNVSASKLNTLFTEMQAVLRLSIEKGGSSDRNYVNAMLGLAKYSPTSEPFLASGTNFSAVDVPTGMSPADKMSPESPVTDSERRRVLTRTSKGKKGSYISFAKVFRRDGKPCPRCGTTIEKNRVAGRGTHICPYCQRAPK